MLSALVLAAGPSKRMGKSKTILPFGRETCLSLALKACKGAGIGEIILILGSEEKAIRNQVDLQGVTWYRNMHPERGQTSSLKIALSHMDKEADAFFIYPADYPLVRFSVLKSLAAASASGEKWKRIFIPTFGGRRGHPILVDNILRPTFRALGDDEPAHKVVRAQEASITEVKVKDPSVILDIDTPLDYDRCLKVYLDRERRAQSAGGQPAEGQPA